MLPFWTPFDMDNFHASTVALSESPRIWLPILCRCHVCSGFTPRFWTTTTRGSVLSKVSSSSQKVRFDRVEVNVKKEVFRLDTCVSKWHAFSR